jgi:hypothetical protein
MLAALYTAVLLMPVAELGLDHRARGDGCCDLCGVESAFVLGQIARLQTCPRWRDRDRAVRELRHVDWHCHPEVVDVLATALLRDCHEEVREEAAESLAKRAPCVASAHEALWHAARCDPDRATRRWAQKGLERLRDRCSTAAGPHA